MNRDALLREHVEEKRIFVTGNTGIDALLITRDKVEKRRPEDWPNAWGSALPLLKLDRSRLVLITMHRRESFGVKLSGIFESIRTVAEWHRDIDFIYPVHLNPNVGKPAREILGAIPNVHLIAPLAYEPFVYLMNRATLIVTDSGGIQEEAPSLGKPVIVVRDKTERQEALVAGTVQLGGTDPLKLVPMMVAALARPVVETESKNPYGDGTAASQILNCLFKRVIAWLVPEQSHCVFVSARRTRPPPSHGAAACARSRRARQRVSSDIRRLCCAWDENEEYDPFAGVRNVSRVSHRYSHRGRGVMRLIIDKAARIVARRLFRAFGFLHAVALNTRFVGFGALLKSIDADVYIAHNIETLVPACRAAADRDAIVMFDCMEFYSDMGDSQNQLDRQIIRRMEQSYLPKCDLVFASSDEMAHALAATYGIPRPLVLYNVPAKDSGKHHCEHDGLALYWRNSVVGFGQRGLEEALNAMATVAPDVTLHLQGRLPADGGEKLRARLKELRLEDRVFIHGSCTLRQMRCAPHRNTVSVSAWNAAAFAITISLFQIRCSIT